MCYFCHATLGLPITAKLYHEKGGQTHCNLLISHQESSFPCQAGQAIFLFQACSLIANITCLLSDKQTCRQKTELMVDGLHCFVFYYDVFVRIHYITFLRCLTLFMQAGQLVSPTYQAMVRLPAETQACISLLFQSVL